MNDRISQPLDYMIELCENNKIPTKFDIFNAKDELKCIRGGLDYLRRENENLKSQLLSIVRSNSNIPKI